MARYCAIFNATAGRRRNERRLEKLHAALPGTVDLRKTDGPGHGAELARAAAFEGFSAVIAAGGDGTVHEVASGLLASQLPDVTLGILPVGSANDYAFSLLREFGDAARGPDAAVSVDVGRVHGLSEHEAYFVNSVGLGLSGMVTIESRRIRRLRGVLLYGLATCRAMWSHFAIGDWEIGFDDEPMQRWPTLLFSVLNGRREGNFVLAPHASLADGWFDYTHAGRLSRWDIVRLLPSLARTGPPDNYPQVTLGRCRRVRIHADRPLAAHVDGEVICRPEDDRRDCTVEILPARLRVQVFETA